MGLDGLWGKLDVMGWDWDGTVPKPGNLDGTGNFGHGTTLVSIHTSAAAGYPDRV